MTTNQPTIDHPLSMAARIVENGLLHPVVVTPERTLIAGERRLLAVRRLGWAEVPITVVPLRDIVRGEAAENADRKNFTPTEQEAIATALRPLEEAAARERMTLGKVATGSARTRDRLAAYVGTSGRTLDKIHEIVQAADADPELGSLVADMDRTGKVDAAYRELKRVRNRAVPATDLLPLGNEREFRQWMEMDQPA